MRQSAEFAIARDFSPLRRPSKTGSWRNARIIFNFRYGIYEKRRAFVAQECAHHWKTLWHLIRCDCLHRARNGESYL